MSKKAGVGQVFIFIVAALTFSLIMIFGYKVIVDFVGKGEQVEFIQFKTDLESSVKKIYTEFGSRRVRQYHLPVQFKQICFVDLDHQPTEEEQEALCNHDQVACEMWDEAYVREDKQGYEAVDENVFLQPVPASGAQIKVYKISMDNHFLCENISSGFFSLQLEGKGDRTELSRAR